MHGKVKVRTHSFMAYDAAKSLINGLWIQAGDSKIDFCSRFKAFFKQVCKVEKTAAQFSLVLPDVDCGKDDFSLPRTL